MNQVSSMMHALHFSRHACKSLPRDLEASEDDLAGPAKLPGYDHSDDSKVSALPTYEESCQADGKQPASFATPGVAGKLDAPKQLVDDCTEARMDPIPSCPVPPICNHGPATTPGPNGPISSSRFELRASRYGAAMDPRTPTGATTSLSTHIAPASAGGDWRTAWCARLSPSGSSAGCLPCSWDISCRLGMRNGRRRVA